jgi:hypothetical protein
MWMSPLQAVGQGFWMIPFKPCLHLSAAMYLACVGGQARCKRMYRDVTRIHCDTSLRTRSFCLEWQKTPSRVLRLTLFNNNWLFSNKYFLFGLHRCQES